MNHIFIDDGLTRSSLRGLKQISTFVQPIESELTELGLTENQIQTALDLKVRMAGIRILPEAEVENIPGCPVLTVFTSAYKPQREDYAIYAISLGLTQTILLTREQAIESVGLTWGCGPILGILGEGQTEHLRNKIKDLADNFVFAYLSVNPKQ
jgi:hypothetical protein